MNNFVEEYKTLRDEIGRLQEQGSRTLEFGILITSGVLALSFSPIVGDEYRWLVLFSPSIFLIPFVNLVIQNVRTTWIIGRYIELCLEPKMSLTWERFNQKLRGNENSRFHSRFAVSLAAPFLIIQFGSPFISLLVGPVNIYAWAVLFLVTIVIIYREITVLRRFTPTKEMVKEIGETIKKCEQEMGMQSQ